MSYIEKPRKSRNPGDRDQDFKIPKKSRVKNPKNPGFFGIFWKSPGIGIFLSFGIFIPGIRDFSKFRDFYPRDSEFVSLGFWIFLNFGICISGIRDFFRGMGYPDKKPTLLKWGLILIVNSKTYINFLHKTKWCMIYLRVC